MFWYLFICRRVGDDGGMTCVCKSSVTTMAFWPGSWCGVFARHANAYGAAGWEMFYGACTPSSRGERQAVSVDYLIE